MIDTNIIETLLTIKKNKNNHLKITFKKITESLKKT